MKFSISFKYSNVTFKNKETKETIAYDTKASEGNTFTFDNVDEDVVIGMLKGIKDKKASQLFAYDDLRTNFINVMARNKCKELYDKLDKNEWKIEDIAISNITIKDVEFTKPTMNAREAITVESKKMKKLNMTKEQFNRSKYFQRKYGKLEYVSESGRLFKTNKGKVLMFVKESSDGGKSRIERLCTNLEKQYDTLTYDEIEGKLKEAGFVLDEYGGGDKAYAVFVHDCGIVANVEYKFVRTYPGRDSWHAGDVTYFGWYDDPDYQRWSNESTKKFGKKFTKESSTDSIYGFYEWLKSNTMYDSGIHVKYHDNEDGTESLEMTLDDRFDWGDDVEGGKLPKEQSEYYQHWLQMFKSKAKENGWEFSKDYDDTYDEYVLILISVGSSEEYDESYGEYDDDDGVGDGQWHVFDYGPDFPLVEQYMIMAPTGDTWPASSSGAICDYDGEYSYSTRQEMEDEAFALEVDGEEWTPTEIDQPYPREVQKAIRLVISRLEEEGIAVDEP